MCPTTLQEVTELTTSLPLLRFSILYVGSYIFMRYMMMLTALILERIAESLHYGTFPSHFAVCPADPRSKHPRRHCRRLSFASLMEGIFLNRSICHQEPLAHALCLSRWLSLTLVLLCCCSRAMRVSICHDASLCVPWHQDHPENRIRSLTAVTVGPTDVIR